MKVSYKQTKEAVRLTTLITHADGSCQILITGPNGEVIGYTDEFPEHEIGDRMSLFTNTELSDRAMDDTQPMFELINGGQDES